MQPNRYSRRLWAALLAEFIGMAIFQIYGGSANDEVAAFGNGLTLAVVSEPLSLCVGSTAVQLPDSVLHRRRSSPRPVPTMQCSAFPKALRQRVPSYATVISDVSKDGLMMLCCLCSLCNCECVWRACEPGRDTRKLSDWAHVLGPRGPLHAGAAAGRHFWGSH